MPSRMQVSGEAYGERGSGGWPTPSAWPGSGDGLLCLAHSAGRLPEPDSPGATGHRLLLTVQIPSEQVLPSARTLEVGLRFGVPLTVPAQTIVSELPLPLAPGSVTLITGPSGTGKSLLLGQLARRLPAARLVHLVQFPLDVAVLDAVAPTRPLEEALQLLTACGLGEPRLWIRRFAQLSAGEQFRARLARAIGLHRRDRCGALWPHNASPLLCDEFGAVLHRRLAKAIAYNLRKLVWRERLTLVVATSQEDLQQDLQADHVVRLGLPQPLLEETLRPGNLPGGDQGQTGPGRRAPARRAISLTRQLRIERGTLRDYQSFSAMHYRQTGQVGFVDKVFVCREGIGGPVLGVVVYGRPSLELKLRNEATAGRFVRRPDRLNRQLRVLKRLVMHPDVRGCGLGHWLVRRTLPLVGTPFVECLAAMGAVNPVFEKAGMRRTGTCARPASMAKTVAHLRALGADPLAADFASQVCRRPVVRRAVAEAVQQWYRATSNANLSRPTEPTPTYLAQTFRQIAGSQPVYYLWARDEAGWAALEQAEDE